MTTILRSVALLVLVAVPALADATVRNEDSKSYQYELKCMTTTSGTINSSETRHLNGGSGCKLTVEGAGSASLTDRSECKIKSGSLSCK